MMVHFVEFSLIFRFKDYSEIELQFHSLKITGFYFWLKKIKKALCLN